MKKIIIIIFLLFRSLGLIAQSGYTSNDNYTGSWSDPATWTKEFPWMNDTPGSPTNGNADFIDLYGYITVSGDLEISNNANLNIYDTLWVTGNLTVKSNSLTIEFGGVLIVEGNFRTEGSSTSTNYGNVVVKGNLDLTASSNVDDNSLGSDGFYVYGSNFQSGNGQFDNDKNTSNWNTMNESELSSGNPPLYAFVSGLLPVELMGFSAQVVDEVVKLTWTTITENNNDYFEIERTVDGKSYIKIGKVLGNGNSNEVNFYKFDDMTPVQGISYYRLKQVDLNGQFEYSGLVKANVILQSAAFKIAPTIVTNKEFWIQTGNIGSGTVEISLHAANGAVMQHSSQDLSNENQTQSLYFPIKCNLTNGIYIVTLTIGENKYKRKIIVNN